MWGSLHILRKDGSKKLSVRSFWMPLLKPENRKDNFERIYFDFFNLGN